MFLSSRSRFSSLMLVALIASSACHDTEWAPPTESDRIGFDLPTDTITPSQPGSVSSWKMAQSSEFFDLGVWYNEDYAVSVNPAGSIVAVGSRFIGPPSFDYTIGARRWAAAGDGASWTKLINATPCISCPGNESANDVVVTASGAIYVAAFATNLVGTSSGPDWRVSRLDPSTGNELWSLTLSSSPAGGIDTANGIAYDEVTSSVVVAGQWNGTGGAVLRLRPDGSTITFDTTTIPSGTASYYDVSVDPTPNVPIGQPRPDGTIYVVGGQYVGKFSAVTGLFVSSSTVPGVALRAVSVDTADHSVCLAGSGVNLASPTSLSDGWARRQNAAGTALWTAIYNPTPGGIQQGQAFNAVAARTGGGGCIVAGEGNVNANASTDALTVSWDGAGTQTGSLLADNSGLPNPAWDVKIATGGPNAGKALVPARGWSINGGSGSPPPASWDGWLRWITVQ